MCRSVVHLPLSNRNQLFHTSTRTNTNKVFAPGIICIVAMSEEVKELDMLDEFTGNEEGVQPAVHSSQVTRLVELAVAGPQRPIRFKFEWRIEQIERLIEQYSHGRCLPSKPYHFQQLSNGVTWQLDFYPNGQDKGDDGHSSIYLSQLESMPAARVLASLHLYFVAGDGSHVSIYKSRKVFNSFDWHGSQRVTRDKLRQAMHDDGSVMLVCEGSFIVPPLDVQTFVLSAGERGVVTAGAAVEVVPLDTLPSISARVVALPANQFTDCSVKVGDKMLPAHSHFLQKQSKILHGMVQFQKKRSEGRSIVLSFEDSSAEAVTAMLEFIYTGSVGERVLKESALPVLKLAHDYSLAALSNFVVQHLPPTIDDADVLPLYVSAHKFQLIRLREACTSYFVEHSTSVMELPQWRELEDAHLKLAFDLLKETTIRCKKEAPLANSKKEHSPSLKRSIDEKASSTTELITIDEEDEEEAGPGVAKRPRLP